MGGGGYYQYFCGEKFFKWKFPCHPTDLVLFRKRIGEKGVEKILQISIELHGPKAKEYELLIDITVREKNITFPTDTKLYERILKKCVVIADKEELKLCQTYRRTLKKTHPCSMLSQPPKELQKGKEAARKLKTIAGRLTREWKRKLPIAVFQQYSGLFDIFNRVFDQQRNSFKKIYSLREPDVYCIGKGKFHKKYEFGSKASIAATKNSGIIVAAISHPENIHDSKTLVEVIANPRNCVASALRLPSVTEDTVEKVK